MIPGALVSRFVHVRDVRVAIAGRVARYDDRGE
jgi:hypothetical protein